MDLTSTLRGEAFRPMATIIAPGAFGLAPFAALAYSASGIGREFWDAHPIAVGVALFILSIAFGLVFENIGSRVEHWIDKSVARKDPTFDPTWRAYLMLTYEQEPIGQRYLRTILFRLKFELGILGSAPAQGLGWFLVFCAAGASWWYRGGALVGALILIVWFFYEARDSTKVLAELRRDLVAKFGSRTA